tara:strand:- start:728 stop:895 length:168 start_codon:yes stop_codon:yes gene_type:complete
MSKKLSSQKTTFKKVECPECGKKRMMPIFDPTHPLHDGVMWCWGCNNDVEYKMED